MEFENHLLSQSANADTNTSGDGAFSIRREEKGEKRIYVLRDRGIPHRAGECRSSGRHL